MLRALAGGERTPVRVSEDRVRRYLHQTFVELTLLDSAERLAPTCRAASVTGCASRCVGCMETRYPLGSLQADRSPVLGCRRSGTLVTPASRRTAAIARAVVASTVMPRRPSDRRTRTASLRSASPIDSTFARRLGGVERCYSACSAISARSSSGSSPARCPGPPLGTRRPAGDERELGQDGHEVGHCRLLAQDGVLLAHAVRHHFGITRPLVLALHRCGQSGDVVMRARAGGDRSGATRHSRSRRIRLMG